MQFTQDFCFCTLAIGSKYRKMVLDLSIDLKTYAPNTAIVVGTDEPKDFNKTNNIISFKLIQRGIFTCYNDKRFVLQKALSQFEQAIYIDADTRVIKSIPQIVKCNSTLVGCNKNVIEHMSRYRPKDIQYMQHLAHKLDINLDGVKWIGESLFIVSKDNGKEQEFIDIWGKLARYLELRGMHSGEGNIMGLAAAKVGWKVQNTDAWKQLKQTTQHLDASHQTSHKTVIAHWQRRLKYHYRLNKARLLTLKDFDFYYR